jgi:hypothetical protein
VSAPASRGGWDQALTRRGVDAGAIRR